jgi:hypothetical protein
MRNPHSLAKLRTATPALVAGVIYAAVGVVFLYGWVFSAPTDPGDPSAGDLLSQFYPILRYGFQELRAGHIPLWNPHQLAGVPFLAFPLISFVYPVYLPFLFLRPETAIDIDVVAHLVICGIGTYLLCRALGMRSWSSFAAGLVYSYHGSMMVRLYYPGYRASVAWIPLLFLFSYRLFERPSPILVALLSLAFGLSLLGGHGLQFTYLTGLSLLPFVAVCAWERLRDAGPRGVLRSGVGLSLGFALGVVIAAVRLVPAVEVTLASWRPPGSLSIETSAAQSFDPATFLHNLVNPSTVANARQGTRVTPIFREGYVGVLPLSLAVLGTILWRRWRFGGAFALTAAAAALYAFGTNGFLFPALYGLPAGGWFRGPDRAFVIFGLAVAILCGAGLDEVLRRPRGWAVGVGCFAATFAAVAILAPTADGVWLAAVYFGVGALLLGAFAAGRERRFVPTAAAFGMSALIAADLWQGFPLYDAFPSQLGNYFARYQPQFEQIRQRQGLQRTYIWSSFRPSEPLYFYSDIAKAGLYHGIYMATDYEGLVGDRIDQYFRFQAPGDVTPRDWVDPFGYHALTLSARNAQLFELLGIRFFMIPDGLEQRYVDPAILGRWQLLSRANGVAVYEDPKAMPRAFVTSRVEVVADPTQVLDRLSTADLLDVAFVEEPLGDALPSDTNRPATAGDPPATAQVAEYSPNEVVIDVAAPHGGLLVLTDQYFAGWQASVDGAAAPIHRADYLFRGVVVPPGAHRVQFVYRPASVRRGLLLSLAGVSGVVLLLGIGIVGRRHQA